MKPWGRFLLGFVGFVAGALLTLVVIVGIFGLISEFTNYRLVPRGPWPLFLAVGLGVLFFKIFYTYELILRWKLFSIVTKFDRLKITLVGFWFIASIIYINTSRQWRYENINFLDIFRWGRTETEAIQIVLIPAIALFFGLPLLEKIINWIKSGK